MLPYKAKIHILQARWIPNSVHVMGRDSTAERPALYHSVMLPFTHVICSERMGYQHSC